MDGLSGTVESACERFASLEKKRESSIAMSRAIIRKTKNVIHAIHVGGDPSDLERSLKDDVMRMLDDLSDEPTVLHSGAVEDALMEYAEASIVSSLVRDGTVPSFDDLGISAESWVMGLADSVGELRRAVLTALTDGDISKAKLYFGYMEEISEHVMGFDVPDAIVPVRRKQDITRGVMERTRSDVTNAILFSDLRK